MVTLLRRLCEIKWPCRKRPYGKEFRADTCQMAARNRGPQSDNAQWTEYCQPSQGWKRSSPTNSQIRLLAQPKSLQLPKTLKQRTQITCSQQSHKKCEMINACMCFKPVALWWYWYTVREKQTCCIIKFFHHTLLFCWITYCQPL